MSCITLTLTLTRMEKAGHERGVPCFGQRAKPFGRGPGTNPNPNPTPTGTHGRGDATSDATRRPCHQRPGPSVSPPPASLLSPPSPGQNASPYASPPAKLVWASRRNPDRLHPEERRSVALRIQSGKMPHVVGSAHLGRPAGAPLGFTFNLTLN